MIDLLDLFVEEFKVKSSIKVFDKGLDIIAFNNALFNNRDSTKKTFL